MRMSIRSSMIGTAIATALVPVLFYSLLLSDAKSQTPVTATPSTQANGVIASATTVSKNANTPLLKNETPPELVPAVVWESNGTAKPEWLLETEDDSKKINQSIRDRLLQRLDVEFIEMPLSVVAKYIASKLQTRILIDEKALEDESITTNQPITLTLTGMKAQSILKYVLEPLQLTYIIEDELIRITSRRSSANCVRFFELSHIFPDNSLTNELSMLIETMVAPDQWQGVGGNSSHQIFGSQLVVSAPEEIHVAIENLLRNIAKQPKINLKPHHPKPKDVNGQLNAGVGGGMM